MKLRRPHIQWRKIRPEGSEVPRGYGISYYSPTSRMVFYHWIGVHLFVRLWYLLSALWLKYVKAAPWLSDPVLTAYNQGFADGAREEKTKQAVKTVLNH